MQFMSVRGAVIAAAMVFTSLLGTVPSAALAHGSSPVAVASLPPPGTPVPILTGIAPADGAASSVGDSVAAVQSGRDWIAQGTTPDSSDQASAQSDGVQANEGPIHADSLLQLVGDMPVPADTGLTADMKCLAQAVYFESRGQPIEGQLAVAEVVINRAKSDLYPDDYCDVITQRAQFSFVHHGRIPRANESSDAWQRAVAIAEIAQQNLWQSRAADALYFHATYVNPRWAHQKTELAQIDAHIFYR